MNPPRSLVSEAQALADGIRAEQREMVDYAVSIRILALDKRQWKALGKMLRRAAVERPIKPGLVQRQPADVQRIFFDHA